MKITATYSPEDNKLRLYASARLDSETYARVKAAGFRWAPKQGLFVAPAWSPNREDLAIELAGEIEAEESTMLERAEAKAQRLEDLSAKRRRQANAFSDAAHRISERFAGGQPILVGHHSERRARKDHERADSAQRKAVEADKAAGKRTLCDYDGVFTLPPQAMDLLEKHGVDCAEMRRVMES